jgi:GT2 family glycosyltransferase
MPLVARNDRKIGVCVLTYNSTDVVESCIRSISAVMRDTPSEIVVVDNASTDGTPAMLRRNFPDLRIVVNERNVGYANGNNVGAQTLLQLGCTHLLFINPDVALRTETLTEMLTAFDENPKAGCVGGVPLINGLPHPHSFRNRPSFAEKAVLAGTLQYLPLVDYILSPLVRRLAKRYYIPPETLQNPTPVYAVGGACMMFTAAAFRSIGGFDSGTFLFQEELIVSERLRSIELQVIAAPKAFYQHLEGKSSPRNWRTRGYFIDSEQHLIRDYYGWSRWVAFVLLVFRYAEWMASYLVLFMRRVMKARRTDSASANRAHVEQPASQTPMAE